MAFPTPARWITNVMLVAAMSAAAFVSPAGAQGIPAARTAARPVPAPTRVEAARPLERFSKSLHALRDSVVAMARDQLGIPYRRGASSPSRGFDCSGLARYVMAQFGISLPRTSREQALVGVRIERNIAALRPGDLLTFGRGNRVSHVGIYIGHGMFVHAPTPGSRVREESLDHIRASWWRGARRVVALADPNDVEHAESQPVN